MYFSTNFTAKKRHRRKKGWRGGGRGGKGGRGGGGREGRGRRGGRGGPGGGLTIVSFFTALCNITLFVFLFIQIKNCSVNYYY